MRSASDFTGILAEFEIARAKIVLNWVDATTLGRFSESQAYRDELGSFGESQVIGSIVSIAASADLPEMLDPCNASIYAPLVKSQAFQLRRWARIVTARNRNLTNATDPEGYLRDQLHHLRDEILGFAELIVDLIVLPSGECTAGSTGVTARPPGPPAPPGFQPLPVEVALGSSGDTITLMTTEEGGFTLGNVDFASGSTVAAANGNVYLLTLAGGVWTATFVPATVEVILGTSGESVTLTQAEDGEYLIGSVAVESGATVVARNGASYALTIDESGVWSATLVAP